MAITISVIILRAAIGLTSARAIRREVRSAENIVIKGITLIARQSARESDHFAEKQKTPAVKKKAGIRAEQNPYTETSILPKPARKLPEVP